MNRLVIELLSVERGKAYGFQEYIFNLLDYFYRKRDDIKCKDIIILCKDTSASLFKKYLDKFVIRGYSYNSYFKRYWLEIVAPIRLKLGKNDLLFTPGNYSGFIKCCPELLVIHDLLFKRKDWIPSSLMRLQREIYVPRSIKKADKIVAISNFTKDDVEHYYPQSKGKVEVIYNSMNFSKYDGDDIVDLGCDYFLAISNNADYKNQKTILNAFQKYVKEKGDKNLVIIGKMSPNSEAGALYSSLSLEIKDRIIIKSNISNKELGSIYRGASCFISASLFEGLGMPVVEAMSFNLPVLISEIPPHREVSMGQALFFSPLDSDELANKMISMDFSKRNYGSSIRELFSERNTSAKYIKVINSFAEKDL